ncbi:MAG: N-6 DNA methylase [Gammaproteobacteria bacterium]|nr:N-6 DNA methylase [Gammaproteobacteria bacterium]MYG14031.1 N-6 DNA methylase [Gammaproteobacteria bacterium]MYK28590.1 N-6 DNA methylase [Gammaproteobacteria bacterium]
MPRAGLAARSERRTERLLDDLLTSQGWDERKPPRGDLYLQHEYRARAALADALSGASKTGDGPGIPEALLVDSNSGEPLAVIEAKAETDDVNIAVAEAEAYGKALIDAGFSVLAIGLAGTDGTEFRLCVSKWDGGGWVPVTYGGHPINWIPNANDCRRLVVDSAPGEIRPSVPPVEVLAEKAEEINRLLREADIKDEFRPSHVAAMMLALWHTKGNLRRDPQHILRDVNGGCADAFLHAGKADLAASIRVQEANRKLGERAPRIATILERLNVTVLTAEHDYLGQLYETFFRYTGGNTIGQYFTPRHVARMMVDLCGANSADTVLDIACGTGGFFVAYMDRLVEVEHLSRQDMVDIVQERIVGFESEPNTAALCAANMIFRGDGSTRIRQADSLTVPDFPIGGATVALMNPPFPHKGTDTPVEDFIERGLEGLSVGGKLAVIVPASLLSRSGQKGKWRKRILGSHSLLAVCQLPGDLFEPFASVTTSMILLEKGRKHRPERRTAFVRLQHDGLVLRKSARVPRESEPNQVTDAIDAINNKLNADGFSTAASVSEDAEWSAGAYIASAVPDEAELRRAIDVQLRRMASFYTRYAAEVIEQQRAIGSGDIDLCHYRSILPDTRLQNASRLPAEAGTIGGEFDIYYGMKELHSREGIGPGHTLIISPTENYNGTYGWLDFPYALHPSFVTVAQTGSIGEAFVQLEPCAVKDDCLVLLPKAGAKPDLTKLVLAAATLHSERWRFNYGRKLTPSRIAHFSLPNSSSLNNWVAERILSTKDVVTASLAPYQLAPNEKQAAGATYLPTAFSEAG